MNVLNNIDEKDNYRSTKLKSMDRKKRGPENNVDLKKVWTRKSVDLRPRS